MPPKAMQQVVSDSTDPATLRPDINPVTKTGSGFKPMELTPFSYTVNLPPHVTPLDAWGIFQLFFPQEQMQIICNNTNKRKELDQNVRKPQARAHRWSPVTVGELYGYLGIRIYMGIHVEDRFEDYWKPGDIAWPAHAITEIMSLRRFQALHVAFRIATAD